MQVRHYTCAFTVDTDGVHKFCVNELPGKQLSVYIATVNTAP